MRGASMSGELKRRMAVSAAVLGVAAVFAIGHPAPVAAQEADAAPADQAVEAAEDTAGGRGCVQSASGVSRSVIDAFFINPDGLLVQNPLGGLALSNSVRSLAVSNVDTVPLILALAERATVRQSRAMGAGLARAVAICATTNPELGAEIELAVAGSGNEELLAAFLTGAGNQDTVAIPGDTPPGKGAVGPGAVGVTAGAGTDATAVTPSTIGNEGGSLGVFGSDNAGDRDEAGTGRTGGGTVSPVI